MLQFLEQRGISRKAAVFEPAWRLRMLESFDGYKLKPNASFIREALHRRPAETGRTARD